ncbi:MAG: DUF2088 domain-containing protein, partial [Lentisphaerae bacterium]
MMPELTLHYGDHELKLEVPDANFGGLLRPCDIRGDCDILPVLKKAVGANRERFQTQARNRKVLLLIADHTRDEPHLSMVEAVLPLLEEASSVTILMATGSHHSRARENLQLVRNLESLLQGFRLPPASLQIHDAISADFVNLGKTRAGTPIEVNHLLVEADVICVLSDMKPHYFAGYSNALKYFLPGTASFAAIEHNHAFALDDHATFGRHPLHPDPQRRDNPVANDMADFAQRVIGERPAWALVTIASSSEIHWACFDTLKVAVERGIQATDERMITPCAPTSHLVVSCGGYPHDESLYTAQRALELSAAVLEPAARVLLLAQCRNGIAPTPSARKNFYEPMCRPLEETLQLIR